MKIFITMLMILMAVPVFAKQDEDTKDLTPPTIKNWYVGTYHTKDYDEMTDEVFNEASLISIQQHYKEGYVDSTFTLGTRKWTENGETLYREGALVSISEIFEPNEDSVLVRFDKRPAEKFSVVTTSYTDDNSTTHTIMRIGDNEADLAKFIDLCKKSSKLLVRVEAGNYSHTVTIDLTNFTKVYDIYAKNRPTKK